MAATPATGARHVRDGTVTGAPAVPIPPGRWWGHHLNETRWLLEAARTTVDPVWRGRGVPHGDVRPVVLVPGFGGGDYTLRALATAARRRLRRWRARAV